MSGSIWVVTPRNKGAVMEGRYAGDCGARGSYVAVLVLKVRAMERRRTCFRFTGQSPKWEKVSFYVPLDGVEQNGLL